MIEITQSPTIITVQQQLDFLQPQYVRTILWASGLLVAYSLFHYFTSPKPDVNLSTPLSEWKKNELVAVASYFSHTVGAIMSIYLFVISLIYFYGGI